MSVVVVAKSQSKAPSIQQHELNGQFSTINHTFSNPQQHYLPPGKVGKCRKFHPCFGSVPLIDTSDRQTGAIEMVKLSCTIGVGVSFASAVENASLLLSFYINRSSDY